MFLFLSSFLSLAIARSSSGRVRYPRDWCEGGLYIFEQGHLWIRETSTVLKECVSQYEVDIVIIDNGTAAIGDSAFADQRWLTSVGELPSTLTDILDYAFSQCSSLKTITLVEGLVTIGMGAFAYSGLSKIFIPSTVEYIGFTAFETQTFVSFEVNSSNKDFSSLEGVLFDHDQSMLWAYPTGLKTGHYETPEQTKAVYGFAFTDAVYLENVSFPSVVTIMDYALSGCSALSQVSFGNLLDGLGTSAFGGCTSLKTIDLPSSLTSIDSSCFENCASLNYVYLPDGLQTLGEQAFSGSGLVVLSVAGQITEINAKALVGATSLWVVEIRGVAGQPLCDALVGSAMGDRLWIYVNASAGYTDGQRICDDQFVVHLSGPNATISRTPVRFTSTFSRSSPFSKSQTFSPVSTAAATPTSSETPASTLTPSVSENPRVDEQTVKRIIIIATVVPVTILILAAVLVCCWLKRKGWGDPLTGFRRVKESDKDSEASLLF
jgi:hypothetical protein